MDKTCIDVDSDNYKMLQQLRENVKDVIQPHHTDEDLFAWLRTRNYDIRKAEKTFRLAMSMRSLYQFDNFVTDFAVPEVADKYEFVGFLGFDKEGSPIRYVSLRNADMIGFAMSMSTFEIGRYCEYVFEQDRHALLKENERTGRSARGYNYIFDMGGFSLQQLIFKPVMETGLDLIKILQDLHPEDIKAVYCINAPGYFYAAFNIFKPILRLTLLERIHVFSGDSVPEKLFKMIDPEVLPQSIGGTKVDPDGDPTCPSVCKYGGKVPTELYKLNQEYVQDTDPDVKILIIPARSFYEIGTAVEKPGSTFRLEFRSDHYSIGLKLMYKPLPSEFISGDDLYHLEIKKDDDANPQGISSYARIQSHLAPVNQEFYCEHPGIYIMHFDNTFSLLHSKRLIYRTEVFPPKV